MIKFAETTVDLFGIRVCYEADAFGLLKKLGGLSSVFINLLCCVLTFYLTTILKAKIILVFYIL